MKGTKKTAQRMTDDIAILANWNEHFIWPDGEETEYIVLLMFLDEFLSVDV